MHMAECRAWRSILPLVLFFCCGSFLSTAAAGYVPPSGNRVDLNFNYDWQFIKQDVAGASAVSFDDSTWKPVSLPHTYSDNKFREWCFLSNDHPLETGPYYGKTWYRKHFTMAANYAGRKVFLEFEGIGRVANFYVNGTWVGLHENGVAPCGLDITDYINFGADNVIAVQVNNDENYHTSAAYNGATLPYGQPFNPNFGGITRDVTLHICDRLYQTLPLYRNLGTVGTYVYPGNIDTFNKNASLTIQAEVKNEYPAAQTVTCSAAVVDRDGNVVLNLASGPQTISAGSSYVFNMAGAMTSIHFWSPDYPYLYKVYTSLTVNGTVLDVYQTPLGVRKFSFSSTYGLQVNGYPLYLKGYAPRCSMEWPCVGTPTDWMNELDFKLMKDTNANFVRPMHIAPRKVQVEAADKFGLVMACPAANNEGDETNADRWQERLDIMRDVTIYFRNNPSVLFYEGCNQILSAQHMTDMKNVRLTWDPAGGRLAGTRSNDSDVTFGIREYSCTMDVTGSQLNTPLWDAEYARGEAPRRVWDNYTPMLNPRWDGTTPDTKFVTGGYFSIASDYHQALGLNSGTSDFIGDYLNVITGPTGNSTHAYFRLQNSEDMVLENLAKYYARYQRSVFVQSAALNASKGINVGGAKIIWSDSVTDGRMHDTEVTRVSGAVDGARLPKETFYGLQVAHNNNPEVYVVGHWNYPAGTVKRIYVASNTAQVKLQTYDASGTLVTDYGYGRKDFFPTSILPLGGDQVNNYVFAFDNVAWQPGSIKAVGYDSKNVQVAVHQKATIGAPTALKLTPVLGPSSQFMADGSDVAMFDVEVVDANGNRCPTFESRVDFTCSGQGAFLGGYNSGIRYSTNVNNLTTGYHLNVECGINRVFVRSTRTAGNFTLNVTGAGLAAATASVTSVPVSNPNGLSTVWPQKYSVPLGPEPPPVKEGVPPPPPAPAVSPAPATSIVDLVYSGANPNATLITGVQSGALVYMDRSVTFGALPAYLAGGEFIRPYQSDAGENSSTDQYQFNLSRYSSIYQLIDAANDMPAHENNLNYQWKKLTDQVVINGRPMNVFKSRLMAPYENCYFAVNGYGITRFDPASNMYLVFVVSAELPLQTASQNISSSSFQAGNLVSYAVDNNTGTRWSASSGTFPQWLKLDLGQKCRLGGYKINWYNNATRSYQYKVEVSDDDLTYNLSLDLRANAATGLNEYRVPVTGTNTGRYVKITVQGGSGWASLYELIVNGVPGPIAPPSALAATPGDGQITLSWEANTFATGYNIMRSTTAGGPYTPVASTTSNSWTDTGGTNGTTYYYVVTATNIAGESGYSSEVHALCSLRPSAPANLTAQPANGGITLNWNAASGATSYNIKRAGNTGGPYAILGTATSPSFTDSGAALGIIYYYVVSAVNSYGESSNSSEANALAVTALNCGGSAAGQFAADSGFTGGSISSKTSSAIDVTGLTNPAPQAVYQVDRLNNFTYVLGGFAPGANCIVRLHFAEIYFSNAGQRTFNVAINSASALTNFDILATTGAKNKATIQEFTRAADANGTFTIQFTSVINNAECAGIEIRIPATAAPSGLIASAGSAQVGLSWNAVPGATSYNIKRGTISGGPYPTVTNVAATTYTDATCVSGTAYFYVVSAVNSGGESVLSNEGSATPLWPLQAWRLTNFGTTNADDPIAGDMAIPMADGIANLMKYALGLDPKKMDAPGLPSPDLLGGFLTLTFNRQKIATDITYHVEASSDLKTWTEIWNSAAAAYGGGNASAEPVTVSDTVPISSVTKGGRFLRLEVTRP